MSIFIVDTSVTVVHGSSNGKAKRDCHGRGDATKDMLMVFDGASSPDDAPRFQNDRFSAGTFAAKLCELAVEVAIMENEEGSAADLLCVANQMLASRTPDGTAKHHRPTASGALVRVHDDGTYSWAIAGDCQIAVYTHDGMIHALRNQPAGEVLKNRRELVRERLELEAGHSLDLNHPTLKKMHKDRVVAHNSSFPVLNGEPKFEHFMQLPEWSGVGNMEDVAGFILFTDGATWPYDTEPHNIDAIAQTILDDGLDSYVEELLDVLRDKLFHDDFSIVLGSTVHPCDPDSE